MKPWYLWWCRSLPRSSPTLLRRRPRVRPRNWRPHPARAPPPLARTPSSRGQRRAGRLPRPACCCPARRTRPCHCHRCHCRCRPGPRAAVGPSRRGRGRVERRAFVSLASRRRVPNLRTAGPRKCRRPGPRRRRLRARATGVGACCWSSQQVRALDGQLALAQQDLQHAHQHRGRHHAARGSHQANRGERKGETAERASFERVAARAMRGGLGRATLGVAVACEIPSKNPEGHSGRDSGSARKRADTPAAKGSKGGRSLVSSLRCLSLCVAVT